MLARIFEFVINHPFLVGVFCLFLIAFILLEIKNGGKKITTTEFATMLNSKQAYAIDVRAHKEFKEAYIVGSNNIPFNKLQERAIELEHHKEKTIIIIDDFGQHSASSVKLLAAEGFKNVVRLEGGISSWRSNGLPVARG